MRICPAVLSLAGRSGQLLDKTDRRNRGSRREEVYIANVVKCRPPNNRTPEESEADACLPYLRVQFALDTTAGDNRSVLARLRRGTFTIRTSG